MRPENYEQVWLNRSSVLHKHVQVQIELDGPWYVFNDEEKESMAYFKENPVTWRLL